MGLGCKFNTNDITSINNIIDIDKNLYRNIREQMELQRSRETVLKMFSSSKNIAPASYALADILSGGGALEPKDYAKMRTICKEAFKTIPKTKRQDKFTDNLENKNDVTAISGGCLPKDSGCIIM